MSTLFIRYSVIGILIAFSMIVYLATLGSIHTSDILQGILVIGGAILFVLPFIRLRSIVQTTGSDIDELMRALKGMALAFIVVGALTFINLIIMIINL